MIHAFYRKDRRGVLLLIILGLLAMFALVAVAFVVLTGQQKRNAVAASRFEQVYTPPERECDAVAMEVFRGSNNPGSAIRVHSLLEDLYGERTTTWTMGSAAAAGGGNIPQIIEVTLTAVGTNPEAYQMVGRVLTVGSGPAKGLSTHIVGYNPNNQKVQLRAFKEVSVSLLTSGTYRCIVNGAPFSGLGFGFTGGNAMGAGALKPGAEPKTTGNADTVLGMWGGANEDYDAVDFQNMLLAMTLPLPMTQPAVSSGPVPVPIPSLHRPELINYWVNSAAMTSAADDNARLEIIRKAMLRPLGKGVIALLKKADGQPCFQDPNYPPDHPDFTGSNPGTFNPLWNGIDNTGSWDVDNDGDGIPDSIWVDVGLPVRRAPDGRLYKPLVALLVEDLDGRLNLNAHGYLAQTDQTFYSAANTATDVPGGAARFANATAGGTGQAQLSLARGLGMGPADINLIPLFGDAIAGSFNYDMYKSVLAGRADADESWDGRYGEGPHPAGGTWPFSGWPFPGSQTVTAAHALWLNQHPDYPDSYYDAPLGYGCPPDLKGIMCVGLDLRGQPLYAMLGAWGTGQASGTPYEINLSREAAHALPAPAPIDNAFGPAELERILRPMDVDVNSLERRLFALSYDSSQSNSVLVSRRHELTTESNDVPCPSVSIDLVSSSPTGGGSPPQSVVELFRRKFFSSVTSPTQEPLKSLVQGKFLAPELLAGLRMNLNRPWGDGLDNNGDGIVDEIQNASLAANQQEVRLEKALQLDASGNLLSDLPGFDSVDGITVVTYDVDGNGTVDVYDQRLMARQLYARHLYLLMMMVADLDYLDGKLGSRAETCRLLAQWAVNVVDFRDRDSIMTCFEYDIVDGTPPQLTAQGWRPDGNPSTDDGITVPHVVWGCERPELLISETVAWHNRRAEDLDSDPSGKDTTDTSEPDTDFDSRLRPQGSLFVELYNPWSRFEPQPMELYASSAGGNGVDLTRRAPKGSGTTGAPVWRLAIVAYDDSVGQKEPQPDLNDPDTTKRPEIERSVYFVDPSGSDVADDGDKYHPSSPQNIAPVFPGRYAVVGPGEPTSTAAANPNTTYLSIKTGSAMQPTQSEADTDAPRAIALAPNANPAQANQVALQQNGTYDLPTGNMQPPVAVVVNTPHRLSVTEPTDSMGGGYYEATSPTGTAYSEKDGGYAANSGKPYDEPLDMSHDGDTELWVTLGKDDVYPHFKVLHLQRLADPLRPYDAVKNPYITVDSMAIDLTTFNGIADDSKYSGGFPKNARFVTRERGEQSDTANPGDLWAHEPERYTPDKPPSGPNDYDDTAAHPEMTAYHFVKLLGHSLGFLNRKLNNEQLPRDNTAGALYLGDPLTPFPWLTWLNRPFVSPAELMLVPCERMSRLLHAYRLVDSTSGALDPYKESVYESYAENDVKKVQFRHLVNFFHSAKTPTGTGGNPTAPLFHRLLDFVCVPSPFVATDVQFPPGTWASTPGAGHLFYPPFNRLPLYREPGRVNINTVFGPAVGAGLVNFFPGLWEMGLWEKFIRSRQGTAAAATAKPATGGDAAWAVQIQTAMLNMNKDYPTRFANPFRSFAGGYLVPLTAMQRPEVEATLLRPDPDPPSKKPLFEHHPTDTQLSANCQVDHNPYFRYQAFQRLGNLVTTRSNVYAVWITVGYFEVQRVPSSYLRRYHQDGSEWTADEYRAVYPDGYALGQELGIDTGEVKRHRAFYIFDRSIPVGFQRGEDYNVEKAVLLKRFIE